jgi:hypothetical protein
MNANTRENVFRGTSLKNIKTQSKDFTTPNISKNNYNPMVNSTNQAYALHYEKERIKSYEYANFNNITTFKKLRKLFVPLSMHQKFIKY